MPQRRYTKVNLYAPHTSAIPCLRYQPRP